MKNKKDIIDLLQNADEDTIGKITEAYPQHSKKNADRLFREIERRTSGDSSEFRGDTVSGVERYRRPGIFRKVTSVAACLAIAGAGVGTAYALSRSKAPDKTAPASQVTEVLFDDDTAGIDFMTAAQFKDMIKDSIHGQDTSFLDDEPETKTTEAVTTTEASISATTFTTEITTAETATAVKTTTETKTTTAAGTTTAVTTSTTFSDPESYLEFTEELSIARGEQKYFGFRTLCANLESVEIAGESQNDLKVVSSYSTAMMGNNYASFNIKCSENAKTGVHYIIIKHRPYTINNHMVTYSDEVFTVKIPITVTETGSDVFAMLDALDYHAISCDGIPTHKLTAPDGTVYYLHLADTTERSYVWRRPSLIADADNEAPLTAAVIAALRAHWDELDITEKEATRDFS